MLLIRGRTDKLKHELVGRYYTITGHKLDRYILVESITHGLPLTGSPDQMLAEPIAQPEVE